MAQSESGSLRVPAGAVITSQIAWYPELGLGSDRGDET